MPDSDVSNVLVDEILLLTRRLAWMIGFIANHLIGIRTKKVVPKDDEKETESQKMNRLFFQSKVLSGGIENKFLAHFSTETKD